MRSLSGFFLCILVVLAVSWELVGCGPRDGSSQTSPDEALPAYEDSARLAAFRSDVAEMVEDAFSNRGASVRRVDVSLTDASGRPADFRMFSADSVVYMYFTPLACWECIKTVCRAVPADGPTVLFVIPEHLRDAVGRIKAEAGVPDRATCYLRGSLGLPVEDDNKVFFFTLEDDGPRMRVENVFAPVADGDVVDAYFSALTAAGR